MSSELLGVSELPGVSELRGEPAGARSAGVGQGTSRAGRPRTLAAVSLPVAAVAAAPYPPVRVRAEVQAGVLPVLAGVLLGVAWALLAAPVGRASGPGESAIAGDGLLALLEALMGLVTGVLLLRFAGPRPALRAVITLVGSTVGGLVAWGAGELTGAPHLGAVGFVLFWPLMTAVLVALWSLSGLMFAAD